MVSSDTSTHSSELTSVALTSLENCSEESICAPGYIQPYGILLVLQEPQLQIVQISQNVEECLGIPAAELLGKPLQRIFSPTQVKQIISSLAQDNFEFCNPFELKTRRGIPNPNQLQKSQTFRGTLHRTASILILELEPLLATRKSHHALQTYHSLQVIVLKLRSTTSVLELANVLAKAVKALTGFDRVMIYRFEADDHGAVIAEEKEEHLESYLGLHYPATDIPAPARKLFQRNWVRHIPDINYTPVALVSHPAAPQLPLDLSDCVLRAVSPYHIEYLQNMGVGGSLTISLSDDKRLWGLIACHHSTARLVEYETRKTCEFLGQFASIELIQQQERELSNYRMQVKAIQDMLQRAFLQEPNFIQQVLTRNYQQLLDLVHAQGAAILLDGSLTLVGQTPAQRDIEDLVTWLMQHKESRLQPEQVFATSALSQIYPAAKKFKDLVSGLLAISIVLGQVKQKTYQILWFRPEQIHTVDWAGKPEDSLTTNEIGELQLCPRKSFELWKETMQEQSYPWQVAELEAASEMRNTLMMAILEFSQMALEQAAERAAIANRAKSQFLAKMSHELRTPLNAILGFTQVITRNPTTPIELQESLGIINRSGEHLLTLINDVLEMSRIEAGQLVLTEQPFNLHRLLQEIYSLFALKASQKDINLVFHEEPDLPRYVCSDEGKIRQILINLVNNAIKFTVQGSVTVKVHAATTGQPRQANCNCYPNAGATCHALQLTFVVEDTGCGLDARNWETIFEAFMQTEQGRHAQGTGLGLSISRQFARLMDGNITVQSTLNQGSTFTCQVTAYQPQTMSLLEAEKAHFVVGLEPGQQSYRILVVEDVPENRQLLMMLLEPIGFEVMAVESGTAAIAQWQSWQPHLILMDIQMPGMDGYEATRQIRAIEAANKAASREQEAVGKQATKIIALTAYAFETDRAASLSAGCNDYLTKPFTEFVLLELIAQHLKVQYRYANLTQPPKNVPERRVLTPEDLRVMPLEWIQQVHEAALDLRDSTIRKLIESIPVQETGLIEGLSQMVDNFQLEAIAALTDI